MLIECELPCGYNENGFCTKGIVKINANGQCSYLRDPEWRKEKEFKEQINILNIVKQEVQE